MTPTRMQERMDELDGRVDTDRLVTALRYVRDDGRR
jgi:hypothetical protein